MRRFYPLVLVVVACSSLVAAITNAVASGWTSGDYAVAIWFAMAAAWFTSGLWGFLSIEPLRQENEQLHRDLMAEYRRRP